MVNIAIIGATGAVGREMIKDVEDLLDFDFNLHLYASERSAGQEVVFRGKALKVERFELNKMKGVTIALMSAGGDFSREFGQKIAELGVWVIDNSSAWRMNEATPLIVPEVNGQLLDTLTKPCLISNPNCSTIQMVIPLLILEQGFGLERVIVSTYQSVSGAGQKGIDELKTKSLDQHEPNANLSDSEKMISKAYNLVPAIDKFVEGDHCYEEVKMVQETRKILNMASLEVLATTIRVPVYYSHSESVAVELKKTVSQDDVINLFKSDKNIEYVHTNSYESLVSPRLIQGRREVFVSRVRLPYGKNTSKWLQFWNVADNLKKGAATNAVQILKYLQKR